MCDSHTPSLERLTTWWFYRAVTMAALSLGLNRANQHPWKTQSAENDEILTCHVSQEIIHGALL